MSWRWLAEQWETVATDLHATFGIDVSDAELMRARTWAWLSARIMALFRRRSPLYREAFGTDRDDSSDLAWR